MVATKRRDKLLEVVRTKGFAALTELAKEFDVSESTIRRDLAFLEDQGTTRRTHGGVFYTGASPGFPHFEQHPKGNWDKKQAIAAAAAHRVKDGDTILLDGGTTTYELARRLIGRPLQIVTNSLPVANLFVAETATELVIVGGYVHPRTGVILGQYANEMLNSLNVRRAVLSAGAVSERGIFNNNLLLVETERAMIRAADEVILVVDSTKLGHQSLAHVGALADVDVVIVDQAIDNHWKKQIESTGVELVVADGAESEPA